VLAIKLKLLGWAGRDRPLLGEVSPYFCERCPWIGDLLGWGSWLARQFLHNLCHETCPSWPVKPANKFKRLLIFSSYAHAALQSWAISNQGDRFPHSLILHRFRKRSMDALQSDPAAMAPVIARVRAYDQASAFNTAEPAVLSAVVAAVRQAAAPQLTATPAGPPLVDLAGLQDQP
jgi:hypothetical protein